MLDSFYEWSRQHLGQWHYVLGYLIGLTNHNWPVMLALALSVWMGVRLYQAPSRSNVLLLYACLLLGLAYEYAKHLADVLHDAIDFLLGAEIMTLNQPAHFVVGPLATALLIWGALACAISAVWLRLRLGRAANRGRLLVAPPDR